MAQSPLDQQRLAQGLQQDLAQAQATVNSGEQGTGVTTAPDSNPQSFGAKAVRIQGKIVGEKEMADAKAAFDKALQYRLENGQFANNLEKQRFASQMQREFNDFQLKILNAGAQMEYAHRGAMMDEEQRGQMINSFMGAVQGATMAAMMAKKAPPTANDQLEANTKDFNQNYAGETMSDPTAGGFRQTRLADATPAASPSPDYDFSKLQSNPTPTQDTNSAQNFIKGFTG